MYGYLKILTRKINNKYKIIIIKTLNKKISNKHKIKIILYK